MRIYLLKLLKSKIKFELYTNHQCIRLYYILTYKYIRIQKLWYRYSVRTFIIFVFKYFFFDIVENRPK